jgi:hypothetical protein
MTTPTAALILLTVPYFIAVIATITYTNKLIKSGKITAVTSSDSESLDNSDNENNIIDLSTIVIAITITIAKALVIINKDG